tara:strand:+ start:898 stop:1536 length:639 start_codon:yes stop_codon:yes gene_type:complete
MKLLISIPTYNNSIHTKLAELLMNFDNLYGFDFKVSFKSSSLITKLRNDFISEFLQGDYTHLLFIDSDLYGFEETLRTMLISDKRLIGGVYRKKKPNEIYNINLLKSGINPEEEIAEVKHITTGLMLIERSLIEELIEKFPDRYYFDYGTNEKKWDLFGVGIVNYRYLSEDYFFCSLCSDIGQKVFCVVNSKIVHVGSVGYSGDFKKYLLSH